MEVVCVASRSLDDIDVCMLRDRFAYGQMLARAGDDHGALWIFRELHCAGFTPATYAIALRFFRDRVRPRPEFLRSMFEHATKTKSVEMFRLIGLLLARGGTIEEARVGLDFLQHAERIAERGSAELLSLKEDVCALLHAFPALRPLEADVK